MRLTVVFPQNPCNACIMLVELARGVARRIKKEIPDITVDELVLTHPNEAAFVVGLDVPEFPAVIIDGIQMTAGTIPDRKKLITIIKAMMESQQEGV